jgi:hypothetical protein
MKKTYFSWILVVTLVLGHLTDALSQSVQKVGGIMLNIDGSPSDGAGVANWESFRQLINGYGYKMNIGLQSENLSIPIVAAKVKDFVGDGNELLDFCPQDDILHFVFSTHLEDADLYKDKPGVASVVVNGNLCTVTLKSSNNILDPDAIPVLAERTRMLYRRYLGTIPFPKILALPNDQNYIARSTGYLNLNKAGYSGASYDGATPEGIEVKTYSVPEERHARYAFKRGDLTDLGNLSSMKKQIAEDVAKHKVTSIQIHFSKIPTSLAASKILFDWMRAKQIRVQTASQWLTSLFGAIYNPVVNVFPGLTTDLDEDGTPDGYYFYQNQTRATVDATAPGGAAVSRNNKGDFFQVTDLGAIEKGQNSFTFSAKGDEGAVIALQVSSNGQTYFNNTLKLESADWKTYKFDVPVPANAVLSTFKLSLNETKTADATVWVSDFKFNKEAKKAQSKIRDFIINNDEKSTLAADPGCTNYIWNTGETSQAIMVDAGRRAPGHYVYWYTAIDNTGAMISDSAVVTVCGITVFPASLTLPPSNGMATLQITSTIPWNITSGKNLMKVDKISGTENATITISTQAENSTVEALTDVINVESAKGIISIPVTQMGISSTISVDKSPIKALAAESKDQVQISSNTQWGITKLPSWLNCTPLRGKGNTSVAITISANAMAMPRTDTIIFKTAGGPFALLILDQVGAIPLLNVNKSMVNTKAKAFRDTLKIKSNAEWSLTGLPGWVTSSKIKGIGDAEIYLELAVNTEIVARESSITIGVLNGPSSTVAIQQAGADYVAVDRATVSVPASARAEEIKVSSTVDWFILTKANWLTPFPENGSLFRTVNVTIGANPRARERKDSLIFKGTDLPPIKVVFTQAAAIPSITLNPAALTVPNSEKAYPLQITSNDTWTVTEVPAWATIKMKSGEGDAVDSLVIQRNNKLADRTAKIIFTLSNNTTYQLTVTQKTIWKSIFIKK